MNNDRVERILQLAWLEGWINTHGAYEKAIRNREARVSIPPTARTELIDRLKSALAETKPAVPLTVGALLRTLRRAQSRRLQEALLHIGVTPSLYRLMEQDAISPLKVSGNVWKKLMTVLELPVHDVANMLRQTHQLVLFRPSISEVLARYKTGRRESLKKSTLEKAYAEMYAKARLTVPRQDEEDLRELIATLSRVD